MMNSMALSVMSSEKWGSSLLRRLRLVHRMVVVSELRVPLTCLGAEEAVPPFEAAPGGPVAAGRGEVHLDGGAQVPFAHHVGVPAPLAENLGQHAVLGRDRAAGVREPTGTLGDAGHAVAGVVAAGQQTRPRRRAVVCHCVYRTPSPAILSMFGVWIGPRSRTSPSTRRHPRRCRGRDRKSVV